MADPQPLLLNSEAATQFNQNATLPRSPRVASVDVFRGLSVFVCNSLSLSLFRVNNASSLYLFVYIIIACLQLMILVDYGGSIFPIISHSPWNGLHLADFVMPFFLFLVGISLALAYKVLLPLHSTQFPLHLQNKYHSFFIYQNVCLSEKAT
jgi:predicted acyltransferase